MTSQPHAIQYLHFKRLAASRMPSFCRVVAILCKLHQGESQSLANYNDVAGDWLP
jgi:hypothetical protein